MRAFRKAGVDPRLLSTRAAARDLAGLLEALGYDRYNLHAVSYGTRVALTLMRDHPARAAQRDPRFHLAARRGPAGIQRARDP